MSLTINSSNYNIISGLFSSSSTSSSSSSIFGGLESSIMDLSLIKSGSYGKLVSSYYAKTSTEEEEDSTEIKSNLSEIKNYSSDLSKATDALLSKGADSIWNKVEIESEDGTTTTDYDKDAIYEAISKFADAYNDLVDSGQEADSLNILSQVASMVTTTSNASNTLAQAGVYIDSSNHLYVDEDYLKNNANMAVVKDLFNGTGSYAYQIATKASMTNSYASTALSDITGSKSYTSDGSYNLSTSDLMSAFDTTT